MRALCVLALVLSSCTGAQLERVETTLPMAIAAQGVVIRSAGGPIELEAQRRLVVRGTTTAERRELVRDYRAKRTQRLAVVRTTVESVAKASAALATDLSALEADLQRADAQIDDQITALGTEGFPVTSSPTPVPAAPAAPTSPPPAAGEAQPAAAPPSPRPGPPPAPPAAGAPPRG